MRPVNIDIVDDFTQHETNPELSTIDYNALAQAYDTTWARSSTPKSATSSVKFSLDGSCLIAKYSAIVNFGNNREMQDMKRLFADESREVTSAHLKAIKERYKKLTGKSFKAVETNSNDSVEIISMNPYNPRRTAYYRKQTIFEIS